MKLQLKIVEFLATEFETIPAGVYIEVIKAKVDKMFI